MSFVSIVFDINKIFKIGCFRTFKHKPQHWLQPNKSNLYFLTHTERERAWMSTVKTYLGEMSHPCCMNAPSANQRLLEMLKSLARTLGAGPAGPAWCNEWWWASSAYDNSRHSYGENLSTVSGILRMYITLYFTWHIILNLTVHDLLQYVKYYCTWSTYYNTWYHRLGLVA